MADHVPHFYGQAPITMVSGGALTGGQLVRISASMTVTATAATTTKRVAVAARDVSGAGVNVQVYFDGVHDLTATGAITNGDPVQAAANGTVAPWAGAAPAEIIGWALEDIANGATGRVFLKS